MVDTQKEWFTLEETAQLLGYNDTEDALKLVFAEPDEESRLVASVVFDAPVTIRRYIEKEGQEGYTVEEAEFAGLLDLCQNALGPGRRGDGMVKLCAGDPPMDQMFLRDPAYPGYPRVHIVKFGAKDERAFIKIREDNLVITRNSLYCSGYRSPLVKISDTTTEEETAEGFLKSLGDKPMHEKAYLLHEKFPQMKAYDKMKLIDPNRVNQWERLTQKQGRPRQWFYDLVKKAKNQKK